MITISLCMIVKNEEAVLARCLDSVKDIADEIIIVDTGSTDSTKEICKKFTDNIYDFEWIDDFSAARNYSYSKATMEYILWLDADDIILEEDSIKFKQLKQNLSPSIDVVMMKYNVSFDEQAKVTMSFFRERLCKREKNYKWLEPVHEYIQTGGNIMNSDICITHKKDYESSSDRNISIYEKLLSKGKELSVRGLYYYARELYYHEKYDEAVKYFNKFLDTEKGWIEDNISACFHLAICYSYINDKKNLLKILFRSFEYDTPRAEICCLLGHYYLNNQDYNKAIFWYKLVEELKKPIDSWGFISHDYWDYIPNIQLCLCYDKLGNIDEATKYNNKATQYKPNSPAVLHNNKYFMSIGINETPYSDSNNLLDSAEKLLNENQDHKAADIYMKLLSDDKIAPFANFRLGEIENRNGKVEESYLYHTKAFDGDKKLALKILAKQHPNYNYEYVKIQEVEVKKCPICNRESELHSCFNMITNIDQIYGFNPVRKWRICKACNHIFAENYPKNLDSLLSTTAPSYYLQPNSRLLSIYSGIVSNIKNHSNGNKLLDVGVGAGEILLTAKEMQFDVTGLDIRPDFAINVSRMLNAPVHSVDIMNYITNELYDVIILGDVIEHLAKPTEILNKCKNLLNKNGIIWISTPNFESAFSSIMKDKDPMWRVCEHLNYFSYTSLNKILNELGFKVNDYKISQHYNGSMEIIATQL